MAEDFGSAFFFWEIGLEVFTRPHGKEEGTCRELGNCDVLRGGFSSCELSEDASGEGFLLLRVPVCVAVAAELLLEEEGGFTGGVQSGVGPVVRPEGLCHIVHGGTDRAFNQGRISSPREASFPDCLGECGDEEV